MFFNSFRYNPFEYFERDFDDSFQDDNEDSDLFSHFALPKTKRLTQSKKKQMKRMLSKLNNQENEINDSVTQYENHIKQLTKAKKQIHKQKAKITDQITKLAEAKKQQSQNKSLDPSNTTETTGSQNYLFKKFYYKTGDMEIEEQYDSSNPKNCFKIIRKQGEVPQIISGEQSQQQIESTQQEDKAQVQTLEEYQDDKYLQFCNLAGKNSNEMKKLYEENKGLTIGQLYDKATEQNLI